MSRLSNAIDNILDSFTMYRFTLYLLGALLFLTIVFAAWGMLNVSWIAILVSVIVLTISCLGFNALFAKIAHVSASLESPLITAFILALIISPSAPLWFAVVAGCIAMLSKYLLTVRRCHVFNPAAIALAASALLFNTVATWWIGSPIMVIPVLIAGLLIARKTQSNQVVGMFLLSYLFITGILSFALHGSFQAVFDMWQLSIARSAVLFFAFVMVTEPFTMPLQKRKRAWYALTIAILYATPQARFLSIALTPSMAISLANGIFFVLAPRLRFTMIFMQQRKLAKDVYSFVFRRPNNFTFAPGQYMEFTLQHSAPDSRGIKRFFTIASSPSQNSVELIVKIPAQASSFKRALLKLQPRDNILATNIAGEFILPNTPKPLVCIAGGVGIVPFLSIMRAIVATKKQRDIVLVYITKTSVESIEDPIFQEAKSYGVKIVRLATRERVVLLSHILPKIVADYASRAFYVSGPHGMVQEYETQLHNLGIHSNKITRDFFPGYGE